MPLSLPCPHCGLAIEPPPKRSGKCPHCRQAIVVRRGRLLTEQGVEVFEGELEAERAAKVARKREERFQEIRAATARELHDARKTGVVAGMQPLVSGDCCRICQAVRKKVFPIETCTVEMLPPYEDCEIEGGCDSAVIVVFKPEYGGPRPRSSPKGKPVPKPGKGSGCLLTVVLSGLVLL
jgi:hypothetical protein